MFVSFPRQSASLSQSLLTIYYLYTDQIQTMSTHSNFGFLLFVQTSLASGFANSVPEGER